MAEGIDAALLEDLIGELQACRFFSISVDTSTDNGGCDMMDVEVHLWVAAKRVCRFGMMVRAVGWGCMNEWGLHVSMLAAGS